MQTGVSRTGLHRSMVRHLSFGKGNKVIQAMVAACGARTPFGARSKVSSLPPQSHIFPSDIPRDLTKSLPAACLLKTSCFTYPFKQRFIGRIKISISLKISE